MISHPVWTPKRRRPVLNGTVAKDCKTLIENKCKEYVWKVIELVIQPDPVHLFVETFPSVPAFEVVKQCKGVTSHELRAKYPFLKNSSLCEHTVILRQQQGMSLLKPSSDPSKHKKVCDAQSI